MTYSLETAHNYWRVGFRNVKYIVRCPDKGPGSYEYEIGYETGEVCIVYTNYAEETFKAAT